MGKVLIVAIVVAVGYAVVKGAFFAPPKQVAAPVDPLADRAARLAAERARLQAEDDARARNWQPHVTAPAAPAAAPAQPWQSAKGGPAAPTRDTNCATAQNNVNVTGEWMRSGGTVAEKGSNKRLSENESFDAAARNRQYVEDNCRGR